MAGDFDRLKTENGRTPMAGSLKERNEVGFDCIGNSQRGTMSCRGIREGP